MFDENSPMFAVTCKIYKHMNRIVSVRILISKFRETPLEADSEEEVVPSKKETQKKAVRSLYAKSRK